MISLMIINITLIVLIIFLWILICCRCWKFLSDFHHKHYSYFDFLFLVLYFTEQFLFLSLYNLYTPYRELWIGMIVLFTTTTASLDKFMMNSRQRKSSKTIRDSMEERRDLLSVIDNQKEELNFLKKENKSLFDFIKERLQKKS